MTIFESEQPVRWGRRSPTTLLRADEEVVPFHGRDTELRELFDWCRDPGHLRVHLLSAPGGRGKTRLARQLVHEMTDTGWVASFIRADPRGQNLDLSPLTDTSATAVPGVLLVIDYAETRAEQLGRLLPQLWAAADTAPVRLLLLARTEGDWWRDLRLHHPDVLTTATTSKLAPLDDPLPARRQAYVRAVAAFADALPTIDASIAWQDLAALVAPPEDLDADRYGNPLTLQMNALLALLQTQRELEDVPLAPSQGEQPVLLERLMLDHEERY